MATTYTADQAAAASVAQDMQSTSTNIQNLVNEMNDLLVKNLLDWDDEAKQTYDAAQRRWNEAAPNMWSQLTSAQSALTSIMDGYLRATRQGVAVFS